MHELMPDGKDLVVIDRLRVALCPQQDGTWIAQGLEIDYTAQGTDEDSVRLNFEIGLALSFRENVRVYGHPRHLLAQAPVEVWSDLMASGALTQVHSQVAIHPPPPGGGRAKEPGWKKDLPLPKMIDYYLTERSQSA